MAIASYADREIRWAHALEEGANIPALARCYGQRSVTASRSCYPMVGDYPSFAVTVIFDELFRSGQRGCDRQPGE